MDAVDQLLESISQSLPETPLQLRKLKLRVAADLRVPMIRNDALLSRYREQVRDGRRPPDTRVESILRLNRIRSESGLATVTVITKPFPCPGRCVYCPTEERAPKSYLTNEPAVRRALRSAYDPFGQVRSRLEALVETGHPTDKIELIIKGGTWSFYLLGYQRWFIRRCFEAANTFDAAVATWKESGSDEDISGSDTNSDSLLAAQASNESAAHRIIGLTIETRPDYVSIQEVLRLRELGVTRVELGVQTLDDKVLDLIVRDHGTVEVRTATRLLKDAGFKVAYHLMPNLPGATPDTDLAFAKQLFSDTDFRPDAMKLYPCVVIETAELHDWWKEGRYTPYDDSTMVKLLAAIKSSVPTYVRLERVIRDIPSTSIVGGSHLTNLRETVFAYMRERQTRCRCIRCRQVRGDAIGDFELIRSTYEASGGTEEFLTFEAEKTDKLAALLRLRIPPADTSLNAGLPQLRGAALIREVHTYGLHLPLRAQNPDAAQHHGFGRRLIAEAEKIAQEIYGKSRIAVISGIGAREYYRKLGYTLEGTYMVKRLNRA